MEAELHIVNAFTKDGHGGNPAGIVLDADKYTLQQKQQIASKAGLSETAFISASATADFKLEFFTPSRQIPHCGHATIATFYYLKQLGKTGSKTILTKETIDGNREIHFINNEVFMQQKSPIFTDFESDDILRIFNSLGLRSDHTPMPKIVNTGNGFLLLQVDDENILANLKPNFPVIAEITEKYNLTGYYIFTAAKGENDVTTRMFAPAYGINEEAATGMAAGPLAAYLYTFVKEQESYKIEQGRFMDIPSPSLIKVNLTLDDGKITSLFAGGSATLAEKINVELSNGC